MHLFIEMKTYFAQKTTLIFAAQNNTAIQANAIWLPILEWERLRVFLRLPLLPFLVLFPLLLLTWGSYFPNNKLENLAQIYDDGDYGNENNCTKY